MTHHAVFQIRDSHGRWMHEDSPFAVADEAFTATDFGFTEAMDFPSDFLLLSDEETEEFDRKRDEYVRDRAGKFARVPGSGAKEGESRGYAKHSDAELELLFPGRRMSHKKVYEDGTFSVEGLDENGGIRRFSEEAEQKLADRWSSLGPTREEYVDNLVKAGEVAMGINPKTGEIDPNQAAKGTFDSKWYTVAHADVTKISADTGIPTDRVTAATAALSAGRLWSGTKNGNIETARRLAEVVRDNPNIALEQQHIDFIAWRAAKASKAVGKVGMEGHEVGVKPFNEMTSAQAIEAMYAVNAMRGYDSLDSWRAATKDGMRSSKESTKLDPPYPLFTSKGTHQVKQALAVLRGEVTPREAISGPKYSSFYSNIFNPDKDYSITNDTWHYRVMAGNSKVSITKKGVTDTDTVDNLTIKERATPTHGRVHTAQDLFQSGAASKRDNLDSGDGMFRDTTAITRDAMSRLRTLYPDQFGTMKGHEFQALIWVHYGGGKVSDDDRMEAWDEARSYQKGGSNYAG